MKHESEIHFDNELRHLMRLSSTIPIDVIFTQNETVLHEWETSFSKSTTIDCLAEAVASTGLIEDHSIPVTYFVSDPKTGAQHFSGTLYNA